MTMAIQTCTKLPHVPSHGLHETKRTGSFSSLELGVTDSLLFLCAPSSEAERDRSPCSQTGWETHGTWMRVQDRKSVKDGGCLGYWMGFSKQRTQTVVAESNYLKRFFNFVSITAGRNRSSQDNAYSCVPAVIVPPQRTDCTNTASPI